MAINYLERPEMVQTSRTVSELYFSALEIKEALEPAVLSGEIGEIVAADEVEAAYYRLSTALENYQGKVPDGSHNQPI